LSDVSLASEQAPSAWECCRVFEGRKPEGLRHRDEEVEGRPWPSESPLDGVGVVALKAQTY
jgi:hypothetical protein